MWINLSLAACSEMHHVHTLTSEIIRNSLNNLFILTNQYLRITITYFKVTKERFTVTIHEFISFTSSHFGFRFLGLTDDSQTWCIQIQGLEGLALDLLLNSRIDEGNIYFPWDRGGLN